MDVTVIIAIYNADEYIEQAVQSALAQPEVKEIVIIEDGSEDRSLEKCKEIEFNYSTVVRLVRHPGGKNRGAPVSWNVGLGLASCDNCIFRSKLDT